MPPFASQQPTQEPALEVIHEEPKPKASLINNTNENSSILDTISVEETESLLNTDTSSYSGEALQMARGNILRIKANIQNGVAPSYNVMSVEKKEALQAQVETKLHEVETQIESPHILSTPFPESHVNTQTVASLDGLTVSELGHDESEKLVADMLGADKLNLAQAPNVQTVAAGAIAPGEIYTSANDGTFDNVAHLTNKKESLLKEIEDLSTQVQLYAFDEQKKVELDALLSRKQDELKQVQIEINGETVGTVAPLTAMPALEKIDSMNTVELTNALQVQREEKLKMLSVTTDEEKLRLETVNKNIEALVQELDKREVALKAAATPKAPEAAVETTPKPHKSRVLRAIGWLFGKK